VDGQQRAAAVREARIDAFPMFITAFITNDTAEQRSQFILVNSTKPLPQSLIYELLPTTDERLPLRLERRKYPALLLDHLNHDTDSPLRGMIKTPTAPDGIVKDNSILRMLENSLTDGALYTHRDPETGRGDTEAMLAILKNYWTAVSKVFDGAWGLPPRSSRLMHGVGISSLGFVMDAITDRHPGESAVSFDQFVDGLLAVEPVCAWTSGYWNFGEGTVRKWNELQNLQRDINQVTSYLLQTYRRSVASRRS
jgi:DGQHR domain-containing protein